MAQWTQSGRGGVQWVSHRSAWPSERTSNCVFLEETGPVIKSRSKRTVMCVVSLVALGLAGKHAQDPILEDVDYSIGVVHGRCVKCALPFQLGRIQMLTPREGWADGWFFPTVGEGTGDNTVLRTADGGHTWSQLSIDHLVVDQHGGNGPDPLFW